MCACYDESALFGGREHGQKKLRRRLEAGDRVRLSAEGGRIYLEKAAEISALFGVVKARKSATLAQMDSAIAKGWRRKRA